VRREGGFSDGYTDLCFAAFSADTLENSWVRSTTTLDCMSRVDMAGSGKRAAASTSGPWYAEETMAVKLPYMALPSAIPKILAKIDEAKRPERFTQDYLATMLGFSGGNHQAFLPMLKRMKFLEQDGTPTKLYDQYRNDDTKARALAAGVRNAYSALFDRNEYAHNLTKEKLASLVTEITGLAKDSSVAKLIVTTFWTLKEGAEFETSLDDEKPKQEPLVLAKESPAPEANPVRDARRTPELTDAVELKVGYTINLNLPETTNPDVFNAIFKSLKEHLLRG
jgi:hypothetical protein